MGSEPKSHAGAEKLMTAGERVLFKMKWRNEEVESVSDSCKVFRLEKGK